MLVFYCCNLVCTFAAVFREKRATLSAKVSKTSFLAFLSVFMVRARALYVSAQQLPKSMESSPRHLEFCNILYWLPEKPLESLFGLILYEETRFFGALGEKPL